MVVVGIDEVGRGCLAGPMVIGAVVLGGPIEGLKDSKKLSAKKRNELASLIYKKSVCSALGWVTPEEVDRLGLTGAETLAIMRALELIDTNYDQIIIDGNINFLKDNPKAKAVIKADDTYPVVSAASIIAKVARDDFMIKQAELYPEYGFDKHVGYGTKAHLLAIAQNGFCTLHRKSFVPIKDMI